MLTENTVWRLRASDGRIRGKLRVGLRPSGSLYDGLNTWVTNTQGNSVNKISRAR